MAVKPGARPDKRRSRGNTVACARLQEPSALYNDSVRRSCVSIRVAALVVLGLAIAGGDVARVRASLTAMSCCVKTHGDCAGVRTPDDCCRGMGHVAASPDGTTATRGPAFDSPLVPAVLAETTSHPGFTLARVAVSIAFKRPHDPPHLHSFALLI